MTTADRVLCEFAQLPFGPLDTIVGHHTPLILAPHADDESLGCGGLIAACCARGTPPRVIVVTDGCGSHPGSRTFPPARLRAERERETREAMRRLGGAAECVSFLGLPDTAAPTAGSEFAAAVAMIADIAKNAGCGVILAPWQHDPHCDHVATNAMARAAAATTGLGHLAYPVWGWMLPGATYLPDVAPRGYRFDISEYLDMKRAAIAAHATQYSNLIDDDPTGFRLPPELLAVFDRPFEVFIHP